jgi:hypothetical protein
MGLDSRFPERTWRVDPRAKGPVESVDMQEFKDSVRGRIEQEGGEIKLGGLTITVDDNGEVVAKIGERVVNTMSEDPDLFGRVLDKKE